jgi:hypothetical protein
VKRWRFRRADVRHPLTAFTPHFKARIETPNAYPPIPSVLPPRCRHGAAAWCREITMSGAGRLLLRCSGALTRRPTA